MGSFNLCHWTVCLILFTWTPPVESLFNSSTVFVETNIGLASSTVPFSGAGRIADPVRGVRAGVLISIGASRSRRRSRLDFGWTGADAGVEDLDLGFGWSSSSLASESLVSSIGFCRTTDTLVGLDAGGTFFFGTGFLFLGLISVSDSELELELEDSESELPELPDSTFLPFWFLEVSES